MKHNSETKMGRAYSTRNLGNSRKEEEFAVYNKSNIHQPNEVLNGVSFDRQNQRSSSSCSAYSRIASLQNSKCGIVYTRIETQMNPNSVLANIMNRNEELSKLFNFYSYYHIFIN